MQGVRVGLTTELGAHAPVWKPQLCLPTSGRPEWDGEWAVLGVHGLTRGPPERLRENTSFPQNFEPPGELRGQRRCVTERGENSHVVLKLQPAVVFQTWGGLGVGSPSLR